MEHPGEDRRIRVAAAGDVHADEGRREDLRRSFAGLDACADLMLLAGDLTTHGEPEQAAVVAEAAGETDVPVLAVLGNHDHHAGRCTEVRAVLEEGGVTVLDPGHALLDVDGVRVGVAGAKGFVGGFAGSRLPDFGEASLRAVYRETAAEADGLRDGLAAIAAAPVRIALLHYAPIPETLAGEPPGIFTMLGSDRLAAPIIEHEPDIVLHGHAHHGTFEGRAGGVPVFNVSLPVIDRDVWVFELDARPAPTAIH
jgi:Icc-related predicted phosphoesterase